jgi:pimeloyl-ACP methyl ester carboxylesterase
MQAIVDGLAMTYTDQGSGSPVLLFVHGFPLCRGAWQKQVAAFSSEHRVLAPDLRGLGESQGSAGPVSMARYADDLAALLRELRTGPVILIGHSMGGYVALAFVDRHPSQVGGLVLVGTRAGADTPEAAEKRRATATRVLHEGTAFLVADMAPKMLAGDHPNADLIRQVDAFMLPSRPQGIASALQGMADRPDRTPDLARIQVPTLLITGAEDTLIPPSESQRMAAAIPGAQLEIIPHAGHLVAFEQAEAFNERLRAWLTKR